MQSLKAVLLHDLNRVLVLLMSHIRFDTNWLLPTTPFGVACHGYKIAPEVVGYHGCWRALACQQ
jgi:hypothetical protein